MRSSPSIVPGHAGETVYLVLDDFGARGQVFRETDPQHADLESTIGDLIAGQYNDPVAVIAFNALEGWSRDVSADIATEIQRRADMAFEDVSSSIERFVDRHVGWERQLTLRLPRSPPRLRVVR
ncbi:MAG TPA: hypothetical protein VNQ99_17520 [Xanthobacteraceae bacterium]|nr:hypothetical protein [Xanthobacteraceae bacterium]